MQITASLVNELRQKTGVGMMQCKKALTETDGDMDKAVELLRKQGAAVAAKRADKAAKEGRIYLIETADKAAAFELSCETEPVSNNDDFVALANMAVKAVETQAIASVEDLKNAVVDGKKINDVLQDVLVKIQENIDFRKFAEMKKTANSVFGVYSHMKGKIGVITEFRLKRSKRKRKLPRLRSKLPARLRSPNSCSARLTAASPRCSRKSFSKTRNSSCPKRTRRSSASRTTSRKSLPSSSVFPA